MTDFSGDIEGNFQICPFFKGPPAVQQINTDSFLCIIPSVTFDPAMNQRLGILN